MISLAPVASASGAAGYYAKDNYYTAEEGTEASAWAGEGAAALGLVGTVDEALFAAVLAGELPDGSVIDARRGDRRPGLDLTFSAPKSVSLVALLGGDERIVVALRQSVAATLAWAEKNIVEARVWDGERQGVERTGNLIAATFLHDVNRNGEPQLHIHAVIANATRGADGRWRALRNDEIYNRQHVLGAVHNADLRARIEGLGYVTMPARNAIDGSFEIAGVPRATIEAFSTRSAEIRAALDVAGRGSARERELAALSTRSAKTPELAGDVRARGWATLGEAIGFDARALVRQAREHGARGETAWSRAVDGVRGIGAKGMALAAAMNLTPRDDDPLVPERVGRLDPRAYAAAQAVASAVRDLSEREAAFDRLDLVRAALERGGPIRVGDVEARITLLEGKGLLVGDGDRLVTTAGMVRAERRMLDLAGEGRGQVTPVLGAVAAVVRVQAAARELGLRRLNPAQEKAAALILASPDRVVVVQGVAGAGKSAALAPAAAVARAEGRAVVGLAIANTIAAQLARDTGAESMTVARFIARHRRILDDTAAPAQVAKAKAAYAGAVLLVDESSQIGTGQMSALIGIANQLAVGRLALVGDTRQLGAVEAGKPFVQLQRDGHAIAELPENLRARSPMMRATAAALNAGDITSAFALLKPATIEVSRGTAPERAATLWMALPPAERDRTLLLASGRAMRGGANQAVQDKLIATGALGGGALRLDVLDRVTVTREAARDPRVYRDGRIVELRTDLPSHRLRRGDQGTVVSSERGMVRLRLTDGSERLFEPGRLPKNLAQDAVSIHAVKTIALHEGDRIRWTASDPARGLLNAGLGRVAAIGADTVTIASLTDGTRQQLAHGDRMLARLDLAYALNVHVAQGVTTDHGIVMMSAGERNLATTKSFLVALTRIADQATLIVDSGRDLERAVIRNPGEKTAALDVLKYPRGKEKVLSRDEPPMSEGRRRDYGLGL